MSTICLTFPRPKKLSLATQAGITPRDALYRQLEVSASGDSRRKTFVRRGDWRVQRYQGISYCIYCIRGHWTLHLYENIVKKCRFKFVQIMIQSARVWPQMGRDRILHKNYRELFFFWKLSQKPIGQKICSLFGSIFK